MLKWNFNYLIFKSYLIYYWKYKNNELNKKKLYYDSLKQKKWLFIYHRVINIILISNIFLDFTYCYWIMQIILIIIISFIILWY